jgi:uncharacterized protein (DUF58 family)
MLFLPAHRLLRLIAGVLVLAALAGLLPELAPVWVLALGGVFLLALGDLALSLSAARPPVVSVPAVTRFAKDRAGVVRVTFANPAGRAGRVRFVLGLPAEFDPAAVELLVELPAGAAHARVDWTCTPRRRGRYAGLVAACETGSRFGLWQLRARQALAGELRVYPNLFAERRPLAALFLDRGLLGTKLQRTIGRGREFEKLRDYLPGDGFDEIHWKATAKRGRPVTKVFQAERTQEIHVIIDASRLSARPVEHGGIMQTVLERYLTAASVLLLAARRQGDRFGVVAYDDRVRVALAAGNGAPHYAACREALHALQPGPGTPDLAEIVRHLRARLRRRALLFFLTDLGDPVLAEDFARHAPLLARQHLVLVTQLRAPGVAPLFAGAEVGDADEIYARLAGHARWAEARALAQTLKPLGITATLVENEALAAELVTQYLRVKRRQAL